jgi:hypothetical protein
MASHQEKVSHEQVEAAEVQLSPEESQRIEAKKQAQAELARRQELARAGQLPRAQVVYMSPEEKAAGAGPGEPGSEASGPAEPGPATPLPPEPTAEAVAEESAGPSREITAARVAEDDVPEAPQPGQSQAPPAVPIVESETPAVAADESESGPPAVSESPLAGPAPAVMAAAEETTPPHVTSEDSPGVGRRLLKAARSLLRRPDDDEETPAGEPETEKAPRMSAESAPVLQQEPEMPAVADRTSPESEADRSTGRLATEDGAPAGRPAAYPGPPADDSAAPPQRSQPPEMTAAGEQAAAGPSIADETQTLTSAGAPALPPRPDLQREALVDAAPDDGSAADQQASGGPAGRQEPAAVQPAADQPAPIQQAELAASGPEPAADEQDELETVISPLPLQEVWPVEEKPVAAEPPSRSGAASATASKPTAPAVQRKAAGGDQVGKEVHSALQDVLPGQSTDSSIELVTPRRPRPKPPEQRISRQVGDRPPVDRPAPARPDPATVERSTEPHMVATEIGELPSDLWGLMGERPPTSQPGQPVAPAAAPAVQREVALAESPALAEPPAVVESPAEAESPAETGSAGQESAGLVTQRFRPPVIQRVDAGRGAVDADAGQAPAAADEAEEPAGESQIDVDKLARQVLPEIKRRLEIDWERGRGRLL